MSNKSSDTFQNFLTIGAVAAAAVESDLEENHGHEIVELERYAKSNKIWEHKVKRFRLPDLMCLRCGLRFESRGKSKMAFELSHSNQEGRGWGDGGMRNGDVFAFVGVTSGEDGYEVNDIIYVTKSALAATRSAAKVSARKSASEGAEVTLKWDGWAPKYSGRIVSVEDGGLVVEKADGKQYRYWHWSKWPDRHVYVHEGESFREGTLIAGCVVPAKVDCRGEEWDWLDDLKSDDPDVLFPAVKAARWRNDGIADERLRQLTASGDWRLALEAMASLAVREDSMIPKILKTARSLEDGGDTSDVVSASMEAVFVLSELHTDEAREALHRILKETSNSELRSAAAWGLGLSGDAASDVLVTYIADRDDQVALHAVTALPENLSEDTLTRLEEMLRSEIVREVASAVHVLGRRGQARSLIRNLDTVADSSRQVIVRMLGDMPRDTVLEAFDIGPDEKLLETLEIGWSSRRDWLRSREVSDQIESLEVQRLSL